jgi:phosphate transport system protein
MDRRAIFFLIAAALAALLVWPSDPHQRYFPIALACLYVVLAIVSFCDYVSARQVEPETGGVRFRPEDFSGDARAQRAFHRQLLALRLRTVEMGRAAWANLDPATDALLNADAERVRHVVEADRRIDEMGRTLVHDATMVLAIEAPVERELQYVVSVLRLAYELERCGDLAVNLARAGERLPGPLERGQLRALVEGLARVTRNLFAEALDLYAEGVPADLDLDDDAVDTAFTLLLRRLTEPGIPPETVIALTTAARAYERIGDHAVNLAARSGLVALDALEETSSNQ